MAAYGGTRGTAGVRVVAVQDAQVMAAAGKGTCLVQTPSLTKVTACETERLLGSGSGSDLA